MDPIFCVMCDASIAFSFKEQEWLHTETDEWHCTGKISVATPSDWQCASRYYWWDGEAEGRCERPAGHDGQHQDGVMEWDDGDDGTWDS